ncbi:2-oxoglutarate dehydrogenase complex dihydrolipoyllysine-residue succinyltransferase [Photobacterium leiognathi]|uniref:Dihydrolipoyllysine-residue succinyltransferase component of 2-oxoglutarate dehydrogenase complex n=2 Tax=Photobacterium leiognathi TaxID=553611 RepID=A0A0U1P704_PHOLE|nr:2-oxoglutarate dehydrogenase complex dihydrolipoyllysine-residue succinyltransferase [Photobacterium leiognathi]KJF89007.1 dihydrolipoamide succinyltransferase [Photobacterium leiognathi]MCG3885953.1 2-oxoglutarate dehydrogenase complex dihydrolipoyllysine-residue succinyltransferase [Photobacterium leiognathi]PSV03546.1 2-oxoglutarate dehydrogenase complex dihydrolipoyllysine-residue succinyltransferase [Photobacterium leiognathi subsp. mandapamensis]PSV78967.1 2-oxoglutarate dehydrogenase 
MTIEILVPDLPESVADATVATWHKQPGDAVSRDEVLVDIETDKVVLEVPAPEDGILEAIFEDEGTTVLTKQLIGKIKAGAVAGEPTQDVPTEAEASPNKRNTASLTEETSEALSPAVRRLLSEHGIEASAVKGSGVGGRITREDVEAYLKSQSAPESVKAPVVEAPLAHRSEKRVPMTRLRKRVAERLLEAKNSTAMLTTFNEVNMKPIMDLRKQYKDIFEERHGIRLGFMSFYVKAVVEALKRYPEVNASIDGDDIVYHNFFDVSIAVSTPRGLVTPVLRDCDKLSLAEIEKGIRDLAIKGRDGKLTVDDLTGGNFTITNGGVFGSLMSTPIINPPQSAILGMHKIQDRPMAVNGQVEILPMMYLALSYDHRLVDGRESVGYLVTIKELLEDPTRLLLDV